VTDDLAHDLKWTMRGWTLSRDLLEYLDRTKETTMAKTVIVPNIPRTICWLTIKSAVRGGLGGSNHNTPKLTIKSAVRGGLSGANHNTPKLTIKSAVRGGLGGTNHNTPKLSVKSAVRGALGGVNHNAPKLSSVLKLVR